MLGEESLFQAASTLGQLTFAAVLGGLVGLEREWKRKTAGLRTHMLVALGAATFMVASLNLVRQMHTENLDLVRLDPIRLIQGIVGGIGFLGAGAIIRNRGGVRGLTTAGSLWFAGALGVAAGMEQYALGLLAALLGLTVLQLLGWLERWRDAADGEDSL